MVWLLSGVRHRIAVTTYMTHPLTGHRRHLIRLRLPIGVMLQGTMTSPPGARATASGTSEALELSSGVYSVTFQHPATSPRQARPVQPSIARARTAYIPGSATG